MSRAFVKEPDGDDVGAELPDRPVSPHPNFVTATGLAAIEAELVDLRDRLARAQAGGDKAAIAAVSRDLRYWAARRASAELVETIHSDEVRFGSRVTIEREDGRRQTFRITGEDEADPSAGTLSYVAPLARALIGRRAGDEIEFMGDAVGVLAVEAD